MDPNELQRRAQLAEELILTDERLRGGLTDDQFEEILRWALPLAHEAAAATAAIEESAAADAALADRLQSLRRLIREAVRRAEEGETMPPPPAAQAPSIRPTDVVGDREAPDHGRSHGDTVEPSAAPSNSPAFEQGAGQAADVLRGFLEETLRPHDRDLEPDGR